VSQHWSQIRKLYTDLVKERKALEDKIVQLRIKMIDCELALTPTVKHPNDPDYPTFIEPARERCFKYIEERKAKDDNEKA